MDEIIPEGTSIRPTRTASMPSLRRARSRLADHDGGRPPEPFDSEKVPPTLVSEIRHFLRVANQIEAESPRVAYLCRFHAFEKAHQKDPKSTGRGVRQFKTALLQRLERDENPTIQKRKETSDARELKCFYQKKKAREVSSVLLEVLKAVLPGFVPEFLAAGIEMDEKVGSYNILPLDKGAGQETIMLLPEIKAAIAAVRCLRGLPFANNIQETYACNDMLEWLQSWFGFQKGNVANQREHIILLLANIHGRLSPKPKPMLDDRAVDELMSKVFENYLTWCKFLRRQSSIWLPSVKQEVQQYKLLYIALYLLIWGEASNLRLMPECLCYIFHHMAYELYGVLSGAVSLNTGEKVVPAYGGRHESFLENVVTPIYRVIYEEAQKGKKGNFDHSTWRNYDDLNEYFWSIDCFKLGWPMRLQSDFFHTSKTNTDTSSHQNWLGKTNFVEVRTFWHLFRSFDRLWTFLILALQIMIIMAWRGMETPLQLLDPLVFEDILSIFVTNAVLRLIQVILDIGFTWQTRQTMDSSQKLRLALKLFLAIMWAITLPTSYATSQKNFLCSTKQGDNQISIVCLSPYMVVVATYLVTNVIGMALFFVPAIINYIETSNSRTCVFLSWWAQACLSSSC